MLLSGIPRILVTANTVTFLNKDDMIMIDEVINLINLYLAKITKCQQ